MLSISGRWSRAKRKCQDLIVLTRQHSLRHGEILLVDGILLYLPMKHNPAGLNIPSLIIGTGEHFMQTRRGPGANRPLWTKFLA